MKKVKKKVEKKVKKKLRNLQEYQIFLNVVLRTLLRKKCYLRTFFFLRMLCESGPGSLNSRKTTLSHQSLTAVIIPGSGLHP